LAKEARLIALVVPRTWEAERGRLMARGALGFGIAPERFLVVRPKTEADALWALEEVLRSGAADLAVGAVKAASLTQTRRLDMAARQAGAMAGLIRVEGAAAWPLSAARRRWRVRALPSARDPWDARASGAPRWRAELARRRDGPPGCWDLEWNDATGRLDLVEGLAGDGLGQGPRAASAG
jgi:protein ImuA